MGNLCIIPSVKARLGIATHDVDDDSLLAGFIKLVSARFESECRRHFDRQSNTTQEFDGDATELRANQYPIESVASFALKDNETDGFVIQSDVEYNIREASNGVNCIVSLFGPLGTSRERLRMTYTGGYVLPGTTPSAGQTALPNDLEQAAIEQTVFFYRNRDRLGLTSASGGDASIAMLQQSGDGAIDLLPVVRNTLKLYERWAN